MPSPTTGRTAAAIMQPSLLGWAGYFALLDRVDVFILDDLAQYVKKSWHNRNRIRARDGTVVWLTIPVHAHQAPLNQIQIAGVWQHKMHRTIEAAYSHTSGWDTVKAITSGLDGTDPHLTNMTSHLIRLTAHHLGVTTRIVNASTLGHLRPDTHHRILDMCQAAGATTLVNTPTAKAWIDGNKLEGLTVEWPDYQPVPYRQGNQEWMSHLSVLDAIAHSSTDSINVIRTGYPDMCETRAESATN